MTITEIKVLVVKTSTFSKEEIYNISANLSFFDRVNYVIWVKELLGIKLGL